MKDSQIRVPGLNRSVIGLLQWIVNVLIRDKKATIVFVYNGRLFQFDEDSAPDYVESLIESSKFIV